MSKFDRQKIFTNAWNGLKSQKWMKAAHTDGTCLYRTRIDGIMCKCAIGWNIPDDLYRRDMEGASLTNIMKMIWGGPVLSANFEFCSRLQTTHDRAPDLDPGGLEREMRQFAKREHLQIPEEAAA